MQLVTRNDQQRGMGTLPFSHLGNGLTVALGQSVDPKVKKKDLQNLALKRIPGAAPHTANAIGSLFFEIPTMEKEMSKIHKKIMKAGLSCQEQANRMQTLDQLMQEARKDYDIKYSSYNTLYGNEDQLDSSQEADKELKARELASLYKQMEDWQAEFQTIKSDFEVNLAFGPIMHSRLHEQSKEYEEKLELIRFLGEKIKENETLKAKHVELSTLQKKLESEKQELLANLQAQTDFNQAQIILNFRVTSEAQDQKTRSDTQIANLNDQITALNAQIAAVNAQLQALQAQEARNQTQIGDLNNQIAAVNTQLQAARDQGFKDQTQIKGLGDQVAAAHAQLAKERQNKFGLLGGLGLGYMVSANPAIVAMGASLLLRQVGTELTVAGLDQMVMGHGMQIAILAAGLIGYATSSYVGPWVADQMLKFINAVSAMTKTILGLSKDMLIKSCKLLSGTANAIFTLFKVLWKYRTELLALLVVGYFVYNAEIFKEARFQASLYCSDIIDETLDRFTEYMPGFFENVTVA